MLINNLKPPWRILFFGTDNFSLESLKILYSALKTDGLVKRLDVVTSLKSKPNAVRQFATSKLTIHGWPLDEVSDGFDVGIVVSFGHLLPRKIIESFPLGILNVHGSLLPRWRGASPIAYALMNGDTETGVTIMKIKPFKFDIGEIVKQASCTILPDDTVIELTDRLAHLGANTLLQCLQELPYCLDSAVPQPSTGASYAPKLTPELSEVKWTKMSAQEVYNIYRAFTYVTSSWHGLQVKLFGAVLLESAVVIQNLAVPGHVVYSRNTKLLHVRCADEKYIGFSEIGVYKKKKMSAADFRNGFISKVKIEESTFE